MEFILVFVASLLGSLHCAGMCGGFVALSCQHAGSAGRGVMAYHTGRLITYLTLGLLAGFLGRAINNIGDYFGISSAVSYFTALILVLSGVSLLLAQNSHILKKIPVLGAKKLYQNLVGVIRLQQGSVAYPFLIGLASTLLPCGWLYTYVAVAANASSPTSSMLIMFFFWLGTLPVLTVIAGLIPVITSPLKKYSPTIMASLMIVAGFSSLFFHTGTGIKSEAATGKTCPFHQSTATGN